MTVRTARIEPGRIIRSGSVLVLLTTGLCAQTPGTPLPGLRDDPPAATAPARSAAPELPPALRAAAEATAKGDFAAAADLLQTEATKGNADAAVGYAEMLLTGRGIKKDVVAALEWLERAGTPTAQLRQSDIYLNGADGIVKDEDRARFLLTAAAEAGEPGALARLGALAERQARKTDVESERIRLFAEAKGYYDKASQKNQPDALFALAGFASEGIAGLDSDPVKVTEDYVRAASAGSLAAGNEIGMRYRTGKGLPTDRTAAIGWFLAAAESGLPVAMMNLGQCYETGDGVPQNFDRAGSWYAKAAKTGLPGAQFLIARLFESGRGTARNPVFAYVNYSRAAKAGIPQAAERRDALKKTLSPVESQEAEKLLQESD